MAAFNKAPELRIVLVGKTGVGKSATGNTILGKEWFRSDISPKSVTRVCEVGEAVIDGRKIIVVDTPGFFDTNAEPKETSKEVEKCVSFCKPGPHVIIHVMQLAPFTKEEKEVVKLIKNVFKLTAKDYTIVVFTRKEGLKGKPLKQFVEEADEYLWEHIDQCAGGYLAFSNEAEGPEREEQVKELLDKIDVLVEKNKKAPWYTEEMLARDKSTFEKIRAFLRRDDCCNIL